MGTSDSYSGEERRKHARVDARVEVHVSWPGNGTAIGTTRNISRGGILVSVDFDEPPPEGTMLSLRMGLPDGGVEARHVDARVVRRVAGIAGGLALAFLSG